MNSNISNIKSDLSTVRNDVRWIRKTLEGNGKNGLITKVEDNTTHRIQSQTRNKLLNGAIGGGWLLTLIGLLWAIFINSPKG